MGRKRIKTQQEMIYPGLDQAIDTYLKSRQFYFDQIKIAELYADVLATESYVCFGIGFTKYLN